MVVERLQSMNGFERMNGLDEATLFNLYSATSAIPTKETLHLMGKLTAFHWLTTDDLILMGDVDEIPRGAVVRLLRW